MNQSQPYMAPTPGHMSHASVSSATSGPTHYSAYQNQPPMNPNSLPPYSPIAYPAYNQYPGSIPIAGGPSIPGSHMMHQSALPAINNLGHGHDHLRSMDPHAQPALHSTKPKVTATLWEDEGTLCFQVETGGICVARREDNRMINGTKLLNVAGMTRGRRDGILKSEKVRNVIKIGPMHLKGVWIPFERALEFAEKEKITDVLYPLFVENINALLYHPFPGSSRQGAAVPVAPESMDRRRSDAQPEYYGPPHPSRQQPLPQYQSLPTPQIGAGLYRPTVDRSHAFPTPPTSIGVSTPATNTFEWSQPNGSSTATSVPHTPSGTPPASAISGSGFGNSSGLYDQVRPMYGHSSQPSYSSQYSMNRYNNMHTSPVRHDMGPPARASLDDKDGRETCPGQAHDQPSSDAGDADVDAEYTHSTGTYASHRAYDYNMQNGQASLGHENSDHSQAAPNLGSPLKRPGPTTPRTSTPYAAYEAPQRGQGGQSGALYYGNSHSREDSTAGLYNTAYQHQQPYSGSSNKRGYETFEEDDVSANKRFKPNEDRLQAVMATQNER